MSKLKPRNPGTKVEEVSGHRAREQIRKMQELGGMSQTVSAEPEGILTEGDMSSYSSEA